MIVVWTVFLVLLVAWLTDFIESDTMIWLLTFAYFVMGVYSCGAAHG